MDFSSFEMYIFSEGDKCHLSEAFLCRLTSKHKALLGFKECGTLAEGIKDFNEYWILIKRL